MKGYESKLQTKELLHKMIFRANQNQPGSQFFKEGCGVIDRTVKLIEEKSYAIKR